jgi:hypothetical protein
MRAHIAVAVLAGMVGIAPMDAAPSSTAQMQYRLVLATGHKLPSPTASGAGRRQNHTYDRGSLDPQDRGYQWDPWGHWGSYYGPMIH